MSKTRSQPAGQVKGGTQLQSELDSILKERGSTYGDSGVNLSCMCRMLRAYEDGRLGTGTEQRRARELMPNCGAHEMAIVMILAKIARIATGKPHADNYDDAINYLRIAKQHAIAAEPVPDAYKRCDHADDAMGLANTPVSLKA